MSVQWWSVLVNRIFKNRLGQSPRSYSVQSSASPATSCLPDSLHPGLRVVVLGGVGLGPTAIVCQCWGGGVQAARARVCAHAWWGKGDG